MLIKYKKNLEKIAMGLLSFMPGEKDVKKLLQTIKEYEQNPEWNLYLWREEDILGAIGLRIEDEKKAVVQHISVNPSHRNSGIGKKMLSEIKKNYGDQYIVCADAPIEEFYDKCSKDKI